MTMRILFLISSFALFSCSGTDTNTDQKTEIKDTVIVKEKFKAGEVIENITNLNDPSQSYALYLPSDYSIDKKYPVLIAFDAHGEGKLPLSMYKELAEQYDYILVGSHNMKNGLAWEQSRQIAEKLFTDVRGRLSVNEQRLYLLGFSGGARVANGLAITNGSIAGVICCGAAAPSKNTGPREGYFWLGLGGNKDFNYVEMRKYDMVDLAGYRIKHFMITFDGKHEWPPKEVMAEAIWWVELQQMRKDAFHKNDSLIAKNLEPVRKQFAALKKSGDNVTLFELCKKTINFYENVADLKESYDTWKALQGNPEVDKALKREEAMWKKEEDLRLFYLKAVQDKNLEWWKNDIAGMNRKIKTNQVKDETLMYQRTLDYLSLVFYMQTTGMTQQNNIAGTKYYSKLYVLVDPTNKEAHYLTALMAASDGHKGAAITALQRAIELGFKDKERIQNDTSFNSIRNDINFQEVISGI